nr:F-box/FBD/LRR-repeat protein At1g13570-like [Ipomoea trifida]
MATRPRMETIQHERRDLISGLTIELKQRILECLPTRDAARMAMLSTLWKNVWLQHGQLVFDEDFFQSIQNYVAENSTSVVNIINNILLLRRGPVKKFTLNINIKPMLQQSDVERWCSFLSRNGIEELTLHLFVLRSMLKLPICIFSCPTIKRLKLDSLIVDFPANAPCIFPGVTSLVFDNSITYALEMNILRELACFPRASPNAQLVFLEHESTYNLVGYNVIDEY